MHNCVQGARRIWLIAAAICFIPTLLISNSSLTASAQEMMRDRPMHRQHHDGGRGRGFGTGVGIGVGIGSMVIDQLQRQQAQDPRDVPPQSNIKKPRKKKDGSNTSVSKKKKKDEPSVAKKKKDEPKSSSKKKDEPGLTTTKKDEPDPSGKPPEEPVGQRKPPTLVTYPVPDFPIASKCNECNGYWEEVVRHKKIIDEKLKRLAEAEKELEDLKRERERLAGKLNSARGQIQKASYQQMIKNADEHIEALSKHNDMMGDIIAEDDKTLAKWYDLYKECVDKRCPKLITQTPKTTTPQDTPQKDTPQEDTPQKDTPQKETPTPVSAPPTGPCPDHVAEVTNAKRRFHRLYVLGQHKNDNEKGVFEESLELIKTALTAPGRQAPGSTEMPIMRQPKYKQVILEIQRLMWNVAKPCDEITIYFSGHTRGGFEEGEPLKANPRVPFPDQVKSEIFVLRADIQGDGQGDYLNVVSPDGLLTDQQLGALTNLVPPDVSLTMIFSSCWAGGFAGPGNVQERKLVQVIGVGTKCWAKFDADFQQGVDALAPNSPDSRVTAHDMKNHIQQKGWIVGEPSDVMPNPPSPR